MVELVGNVSQDFSAQEVVLLQHLLELIVMVQTAQQEDIVKLDALVKHFAQAENSINLKEEKVLMTVQIALQDIIVILMNQLQQYAQQVTTVLKESKSPLHVQSELTTQKLAKTPKTVAQCAQEVTCAQISPHPTTPFTSVEQSEHTVLKELRPQLPVLQVHTATQQQQLQ
jgi:uncharacterized protein YueI